MHIAISGNIGSGKTTLVEMLAGRLGWTAYYEEINNPYLNDFYQDMERWSFKMQVAFLSQKVRQIHSIEASAQNVIQDRTVFEEGHIFVENLHDMTLMTSRDYLLYMELFQFLTASMRKPDLVIYLKGSVATLIAQIQKRGREFEMDISETYLQRLNDYYNRWIEEIYDGKVVVVDIDHDDFLLDEAVFERIVATVKEFETNAK